MPLRILVIDDVSLIAESVTAQIRRAAFQSNLTECRLDSITFITISGGDEVRAANAIEAAIFDNNINVIVTDRGISASIEEKRGNTDRKSGYFYHRKKDTAFDHVEKILKLVKPAAIKKVRFVIVYTFDDPVSGSPWFVDANGLRSILHNIFERTTIIETIRTHHDIYSEMDISLFNPIAKNSDEYRAKGSDLQLYGFIVGEMAWRHLSISAYRRYSGSRLSLRRWLVQNYFVFATFTFSLGVGVNTAYDMLKTSSSPGALLAFGVVVGIFIPFILLLSNPRLLMLPGAEDE